MEMMLRNLRIAARTLRRSPGFTAIAVLTLALGIGANTAVFSVIDAVLLRPLPYPEPEEVMQIRHVNGEGGSQLNMSYPNFVDLRERNRSFQDMAAYNESTATLSGGGGGVRAAAAEVTASFFDVLDVRPRLGRVFVPGEEGTGAAVVVVSYGYWQGPLGGTEISDAVVRVSSRTYQVIGVMPRGFDFPAETELWFPSEATLANQNRTGHNFHMIGRVREGVTVARAQDDLSAVARRLKAEYGEDTRMADALAVPLREELVGSARPALLIISGAAAFLLLIACANVVNLLLARLASRDRELSIRQALGAGRRRLAEQFLTEALLLALAGGALGVVLALWGVPALLALEPGGLPRAEGIGVNWSVLGFAFGAALVAALVLGLIPAWRAGKGDVRAALASGQRTLTGGTSSHRVRAALAVSQVALTLVLLIGAGLLARSFLEVLSVDPGFRTENTVVMDLWVPYAGGDDAETRLRVFHERVLGRVRALPGVEAAGGVNSLPLSDEGRSNGTFIILNSLRELEGVETMSLPEVFEYFDRWFNDPSRTGNAEYRVASDGYFRAMGIPLIRGRLFEVHDGPDAPHVAVISQSLAETRWPDEDPIGKLIEYGNMDRDLRPFTIVGIVGDVREATLEAEPRATFYASSRQRPTSTFRYHVVMRGSADPATLASSARRIVRELNPEVPLRFRTLEQVMSASLSDRRFTLFLLIAFGVTALLVATLGIYGVISYLAAQRTKEIGIRLALGAGSNNVLRLMVRQGLTLALAGLAIGIAAAFATSRLLASLLYGVGATDPMTFVGVSLVLLAVALLASFVPARRATRVDPMIALRAE